MLRRIFQQLALRKKADAPVGGTFSMTNPNPRGIGESIYAADGFASFHNHEFMQDARFRGAYDRGLAAVGADYEWHWRVHIGLWAAQCSARLPGDFVECGVNYGFLSSAIMQLLDWNSLDKTFYLLDTFQGIEESQLSDAERHEGALEQNRKHLETAFYVKGVERARKNFSEWKNVSIIEGAIPGTLPRVLADKIAFLHLDMNCAEPEVAAAEHFWPRLTPGAMVLLDDYASTGFRQQKLAMDKFAAGKNVPIVSLPTGQGLMVA